MPLREGRAMAWASVRVRRAHFWDTETFVLQPRPCRPSGSRPRFGGATPRSTSPASGEGSRLEGASFLAHHPRPAVSGYWPASTAAFHKRRHRLRGRPLPVRDRRRRFRTRLAWNYSSRPPGSGSIGHHDGYRGFRIDGVTGPDEYSAIADNNVYTNLMAQKNLLEAADAAERHPDRAGSSGSDPRRWPLGERRPRPCSSYDEALGVHPQAEEF